MTIEKEPLLNDVVVDGKRYIPTEITVTADPEVLRANQDWLSRLCENGTDEDVDAALDRFDGTMGGFLTEYFRSISERTK